MRIAVVGAGISGLANAFEAVEAGHEVQVFERNDRPGGNIRTEREDGYTVEWGPNGFLDNVPETLDLVRRVGLAERLQVSSDLARRRFLYRRGRLRELPESPPAFLRSAILSVAGRLRVLLEPFARSRPEGDESVFDFAARRIGRQSAKVLVQAMVSGVFAGDSRRLSLRATFPKMWAMETAHGSLFRALRARRKAGSGGGGPSGPGGVLTSFTGGMADLVGSLVDRLGERLHLESPVEGLAREEGGWRLLGPDRTVDLVVLACPSREAARILAGVDREASDLLGGIRGAPVTVVATAYEEVETGGAPQGFGFLVPRGEGIRILGCLFTSSIYPATRAPAGKVLLRAMVGGATDPAAADLEDGELLDLVSRELRAAMNLTAAPIRHWIFRHPRGIPQYEIGHRDRLAAVLRRLRPHRGISVNSTISEARRVWG